MSPDTRWMSSVSAPTAGSADNTTSAAANPANAAPPAPAAPTPTMLGQAAPPLSAHQARLRSVRAAAIRARTWQAAWRLALREPRVATFEGLAANPAAGLERALRWCLAGAAVGLALPAGLSLVRGAAPLWVVWVAYVLLVVVSVAAFAGGTAVACALAAHLPAYGLRWRPRLLEREPPPAASGLFQRALYARLAFACAAYAAPLSVALGAALVAPGLLRGLLLVALSLHTLLLTVLAVRAACRVSWTWAIVAGTTGALAVLLPLAAVAGAWVGLMS